MRRVQVQKGNVPLANGSSRVTLGGTDVVVGVKLELGRPDADEPNKGKIQVEVEVSSTASPTYKGRGGAELAAEMASALQGLLRTSSDPSDRRIDPSSLSIVSAKMCWIMYIDAVILSVDGNLLDALSLAVKAALADTEIPKVEVTGMEEEEDVPEVEIDSEETWKFDTSSVPIFVTVCKVDHDLFVDPTMAEEACMDAALAIGISSTGRITAITKFGEGAILPTICGDMIHLAQMTGTQLLQRLEAVIQ